MAQAKEIVFGTGNKAKIQQVQGALGDAIQVRGINEFGIDLSLEEDGKTAQENARKKAIAYTDALGRAVFAMDNALYLDDLPDNEQSGLYVRRIGGIECLTDEEMIESYTALVKKLGEKTKGYWEFGASIAQPDGTSIEDSIISPRLFVAKPSDKALQG